MADDAGNQHACQQPAMSFSSLPAELLFEIAIHSPIRTLRKLCRFNARLVACVRLQRWFRTWETTGDDCLSVGDRVLLCGGMPNVRIQYATAAAQVQGGEWKILLLNGTYVNVRAHRVRRLQEWADGPWKGIVGLSAAVASASRARSAASMACAEATHVLATGMRAVANARLSALAIAAATAASTAAVAATAASSTVAPEAANSLAHAQEADELLLGAQQMHEAMLSTQSAQAAQSVQSAMPSTLPASRAKSPCEEDLCVLAKAASAAAAAAAEAAAEAKAATSAAEAATAASSAHDGALVVTASTAATAASAAEQVLMAVTAIASAPASSDTAAASEAASEAAAGAVAEVAVAELALSSILGHCGGGEGASSSPTAPALGAAQAAAKVILRVAEWLPLAFHGLPWSSMAFHRPYPDLPLALP